jgi:hypothetical protein
MASVIIASELNKIKTGLESGDTNVKDELGSFLQKYGSNDEEIRENSDEFADPDLYELVLDKGPDVLPPDLFLRLMMVYSMLGAHTGSFSPILPLPVPHCGTPSLPKCIAH